MSSSRHLPVEVTELYSPIGLLPIDTFTGRAPIGRVNAFLDSQKGRVLTATRGVFALPLRVSEKEHTTEKQTIDAVVHRTDRTGNIEIRIPEDLGRNNIIIIF
jgi:hypothetical protein